MQPMQSKDDTFMLLRHSITAFGVHSPAETADETTLTIYNLA